MVPAGAARRGGGVRGFRRGGGGGALVVAAVLPTASHDPAASPNSHDPAAPPSPDRDPDARPLTLAPLPTHSYGEHTDYDGFTILQREGDEGAGGGGLEIQTADGEWVGVPSAPHSLTINIGDLFARWTNDRWKATRHRVAARAPPAGDAPLPGRLSIAYFTGPHPDTLVACLPSTKCRQRPAAYEPITARAHVEAKMHAATQQARAAAESGQVV